MRNNSRTHYEKGRYVYGNAARQFAPGREEKEERVYENGQRVKVSARELRNRDKALQMNGAYVFFLAIISVFCLSMGVVYLGIQSQITNTREEITQLKNDINTLTAKNEAVDYAIQEYITSDHILDVAMNQLGMVEADSDQVVFYKNSDSEYTIQYKDIPTK